MSSAVAEGSLGSTRMSEAVSRVRQLAADLVAARAAAGQPSVLTPAWPRDEAELVRTFDGQPGAAEWRARASGQYIVVRLEADPNIAVGATPWGPFAATSYAEAVEAGLDEFIGHAAFEPQSVWLISPERSVLPSFQAGQHVLVVGRDIHQHRLAREVVDRLRSENADVLVVDMGWPSEDRQYADVATFGASLLMGRALLNWLALGSRQLR